MVHTDQITIKEARNIMRPQLRAGTTCPCCNQPVRMYSRGFTSSMAAGLVMLHSAERIMAKTGLMNFGDYIVSSNGYFHLENFFKLQNTPASTRGDMPKARFWNLLEPECKDKEDGNPNNGLYRLTDYGRQFVEGNTTIMSHIILYNNQMYGFDKESKSITIHEALKNKFDYNELINKTNTK